MNTSLVSALSEVSALRAAYLPDGYAIAYGSQANHSATGTSDLDLLFVGAALEHDRVEQLADDVVALHHRYGLSVDIEVPFAVKLCADASDIAAAGNLGGFELTRSGDVWLPPLDISASFLASKKFKLRLILNALSSPHAFLGGNLAAYQQNRELADRATALLALSLLGDRETVLVSDAVSVLSVAADGATNKDHLGYTPGPELCATVLRGISLLLAEGAVATDDWSMFVQRSDVRRRLLSS